MIERMGVNDWIAKRYEDGHAAGTLATAAVGLLGAFCRADAANRRAIIENLIRETVECARVTQGWQEEADEMRDTLRQSAWRIVRDDT